MGAFQSTNILILSQTTSPHRILLPLGVIAVRTRCQVCAPLREQNSEREEHPITRFKQGSISFSPLLSADLLVVGTIPLSLFVLDQVTLSVIINGRRVCIDLLKLSLFQLIYSFFSFSYTRLDSNRSEDSRTINKRLSI